MESEEKLKKIRNEALRKIGRNMINFQMIEVMLKFLNAYGTISGYGSELEANQTKRAKVIKKHTMGQLIGQFLENTYSKEKNIETPINFKEFHFSMQFSVECENSQYENQKQALASLVDQRNDLIHHLLPRFNFDSIESCLEIDQYLEQQNEKLLPEFYAIQDLCNSLRELRKGAYEYIISDEGMEHFFSSELKDRLVILLTEIANKAARKDGWTLLQTVGKYAPEEIIELKDKLGHKTLKAMILATKLFKIYEEPTEKGGIRVLYRLKPNVLVQTSSDN